MSLSRITIFDIIANYMRHDIHLIELVEQSTVNSNSISGRNIRHQKMPLGSRLIILMCRIEGVPDTVSLHGAQIT